MKSRSKKKKTYRGRSPIKTIFKTLLVTLLVILVLFVGAFFYFQQFIVYDDGGGLHLEVPFLDRANPSPSSSPDR